MDFPSSQPLKTGHSLYLGTERYITPPDGATISSMRPWSLIVCESLVYFDLFSYWLHLIDLVQTGSRTHILVITNYQLICNQHVFINVM